MKHSELLHDVLKNKKTSRPPFWFMRQAGRSLPEYRKLRSNYKHFMEFCYTPEASAEATLQPIKRFDMDAAIIFSDILVIPQALGMNVSIISGEGIKLESIRSVDDAKKYQSFDQTSLQPVYDAISLTRSKLADDKSLIGFAGAPWTLLCYMVRGGSSKGGDKHFGEVKTLMQQDPALFSQLTDLLVECIIKHARAQLDAGADIFQLFDSWSGILNEDEFQTWSIDPTKKIIAGIKQTHPDVPIIAFPRQAGTKMLTYAKQSGANAISTDESVSLEWIASSLQPAVTVQGLLSNEMLAGEKSRMLDEAARIVEALKHHPFIFNLSHGVLPQTPLENIQALCDYLKSVRLAS